jgi:transcriptional regulator with XRE-family HTH domain
MDPKDQVDPLSADFRRIVAATLHAQGLSRAELATRLGCSEANVTQVLRAGQNVTLQTISNVGGALGINFALTSLESAPTGSRGGGAFDKARAQLLTETVSEAQRVLAVWAALPPDYKRDVGAAELTYTQLIELIRALTS